MEIIPAIDIKAGRCVRLYQGDYRQETVFSDDPVGVALGWQRQGATRLHLVDLDGAATGELVNMDVIKSIAAQANVPLQVGGGIRTAEAASTLLGMGAERVVLGTAAVEDTGLMEELIRDRGAGAIIVAVDARDGMVAVKGWTQSTAVTALDLVRRMEEIGVARFLYTDISRDGTLTEPNFGAVSDLVRSTDSRIIASGGVSSLEHISRLAGMGAEAAILGRALYTGDLDLGAAIKASKTSEHEDG